MHLSRKAVYNSATAGWEESIAVRGASVNLIIASTVVILDQGNRDTLDGRLPNTNYRNNNSVY